MKKALISAPYLQNDINLFTEELAAKGIDFTVYPVKERMEEDELLEHLPHYNGIICGDDRITAKVIDACPDLNVIVKWGTGIDSINSEYAQSKGITVKRTPDAFSEPVSDSVIGMMLVYARRILESDRLMKQGQWAKTPGFCLEEQVLGIIGLGDVGTAVAKKAKAFGIKMLAYDIKDIPKEKSDSLNVEMTDLDRLLSESDYVSLNCDLNPTSKFIMNKETISKMKSTAILINTARGPLVKEVDIIDALQNGVIAGAGLDVFEDEPLPIDSPLRKMDNVLLSSHNVNVSPMHWNKVHRNSLNMLYEGLGV